jgi:hypothetical protein
VRDRDRGWLTFQHAVAGNVGEGILAAESGASFVSERTIRVQCQRAVGRRIDEDCCQGVAIRVRVVLQNARTDDRQRLNMHVIGVGYGHRRICSLGITEGCHVAAYGTGCSQFDSAVAIAIACH